MSFPRYERYKDSGVEWLGEIPEGWKTLSVGRLFELGRGRVISHGEITDNTGEYPVYSSQTENDGVMGRIDTYDFEGDYLTWTTDGANAGTVFRRRGKFNCTNVCGTLKARNKKAVLDYCVHALSISTASFVRQDINPKLMNNVMAKIKIPIPLTAEQHIIASFLDRETAKIDALITEQQKLIALLTEKRQAVISHAVTKGLNPDVPMKDSGIEWLGEVPEHWNIRRVKYVAQSIEQGWSPQCESYPAENGEWGVLKVGCVNGGVFSPTENKAIPPDLTTETKLTIRVGDLLISRANTRELVGSAAVALADFPTLMLCDKLYRLRLQKSTCMLPEFLGYFLGTSYARSQIELAATGASSSMLNISQSTVMDLIVPLPSIDEQEEILLHIGHQVKRLTRLANEVRSGIQLLNERRIALISAAVTGKIDVRAA